MKKSVLPERNDCISTVKSDFSLGIASQADSKKCGGGANRSRSQMFCTHKRA